MTVLGSIRAYLKKVPVPGKQVSLTFASTYAQSLTSQQAQEAETLVFSGTPGGGFSCLVPARKAAEYRTYNVRNLTGNSATVAVSGQSGAVIPAGNAATIRGNGTTFVLQNLVDLSLDA